MIPCRTINYQCWLRRDLNFMFQSQCAIHWTILLKYQEMKEDSRCLRRSLLKIFIFMFIITREIRKKFVIRCRTLSNERVKNSEAFKSVSLVKNLHFKASFVIPYRKTPEKKKQPEKKHQYIRDDCAVSPATTTSDACFFSWYNNSERNLPR